MLLRQSKAYSVTRTKQAEATSVQIPPLIPQYERVSERYGNKSKQTNTTKLRRNMSTNTAPHLSLRVKRKPVWPCCTVTSDRHAEGETPNIPTEKRNKETPQILNVPPLFINTSSQSTRTQPLIFKRKWLLANEQLYFLLLRSVAARDPRTIKVESP